MNPTIQHAREVALSIPQPTPAELEHALELHRAALVCESRKIVCGNILRVTRDVWPTER